MNSPRSRARSGSTSRQNATVRWLIRNNHINRTYLLALLGLACGSHLSDLGGASPVIWTLLVLSCYAWPHLAWWLARRSSAPLQAEQRNFLMETTLAAAWAAAFGFPVWISVVFVVCNSINFVVFLGARVGLPRLVASLVLGAALVWFSGLHYPIHLGTAHLTTGLCILALTSYIVLLSESTHRNAQQLRKSNRMLREQYEEIQALQSLLQEQTLHDPLTGLYNRRHLDDVLAPKLERSQAAQQSLALLLVDIDRFKLINDTLGDAAGDAALQALARLLLRQLHPEDMAFRYRGDSFLLVLSDVSQEAALQRADALRKACTQSQIHLNPPGLEEINPSLTLSCGVALFPGDAQNADNLIACVDQALYAAQRLGGDHTVAYTP